MKMTLKKSENDIQKVKFIGIMNDQGKKRSKYKYLNYFLRLFFERRFEI